MSASTATGTTATAKGSPRRIGRFAPSPTGPLHLGSLTTAVASFLDARQSDGRWIVRIEDLDAAREVPGTADRILHQLESLGLGWDGPVEFQSKRIELYREALSGLRERGLTYECSCSRRDRGGTDDSGGYAGTCRAGPARTGPTATRFRADLFSPGPFEDRVHGLVEVDATAQGDPIVRRRDGCFAYQLAVVVDDNEQGVTDVVRGDDLLPSTGWQRSLQRALNLSEPSYAHLPLVCELDGSKLSKSARALAVACAEPQLLWRVLTLLKQQPPPELVRATLTELWEWAIANWRLRALSGVASLPAD